MIVVTKLAPAMFMGLVLGFWFLSTALGNMVAGILGGFFDEKHVSTLTVLFGSMGGVLFLAALILIALTPCVRRLMGNVH